MHANHVAALDSRTLARRLGELAGSERAVQVDFLLHLAEFDARRAWAELGHGSLWDYCLRVLHLREGAAGRRIGAMRALRRFPRLEAALRDGRLCPSTAVVLAPHLNDDNLEALVARSAFKTKAEVEHLAAQIAPRAAPMDGVRRVVAPHEPAMSMAVEEAPQPALDTLARPAMQAAAAVPAARPPVPPVRPTITAVAAETYSLRVTVDDVFKRDLDSLKSVLSHVVPDGDLAAVLHEAVRCALEKHGKRKGSVGPSRAMKRDAAVVRRGAAGTPAGREYITASVRREVWRRDQGRCAFVSPDGHRCTSTWKLELDHIHPAARGGASTADNLRLACRVHNLLHAEHVFGAAHMAAFRRATRTGEDAIAGDSETRRAATRHTSRPTARMSASAFERVTTPGLSL